MPVPYTFGTATAAIPLSQLDSNFATAITLGNTAVYLGNTTTSIGNLTLTNVTISSGEVTTGNVSVSGNVTLSGGTANGVAYLNGSKVLTTGSALAFNGSKLGIGVTSFDVPLQVQAITGGLSMRLNGRASPNDGYSDIGFYNSANTTQHAGIGAATSGMVLATNIAAPIQFQINSAEAMRLDASGRLGIGISLPTVKLDVAGASGALARFKSTGNYGTVVADNDSTTGGGAFACYKQGAQIGIFCVSGAILGDTSTDIGIFAETGSSLKFYTNGSGTVRMTIGTGGTVTMSAYGAGTATFSAAGVISSVSDETWKIKDGVPIDPDSMLKKLEPGYWYYNEEKAPTFGADRQLGFYAQNVNAAIGPEAAPTPEEGKPWGYYDRSVLAVTVMSLQKALATIETLTARITALESA